MDYVMFMRGMVRAEFDSKKCAKCGGNGLKPVFCCGGYECGCKALPVDFIPCECGIEPITKDNIALLAEEYFSEHEQASR